MSAREEILARVRGALSGDVQPEPGRATSGTTQASGGRAYRTARAMPAPADPAELAALLQQFVERVEDYRAAVVRTPAARAPAAVAAALAGVVNLLVPEGFPQHLLEGVPTACRRHDGAGLSSRELDGFDAVLTTSRVGIAVTGTIVLDHGAGQGRRALTLVPDRHVCVVSAGQVVGTVAEAVVRLDPARPQTWISGPSATSDIELHRVEGVHGPRTLQVILVEPDDLPRSDQPDQPG